MKRILLLAFLALAVLTSCSKSTAGTSTVVKPKYHHSWYKNHVYKKKWHVGRIRVRFEKQGVKKVKMKG
jgi:transposase